MKAHRNLGGTVIEIDVDTDPNGMPILPPDTTTDPKPEALEGHYVTVVGNAWVQIPVPQVVVSFDTKKQQKLEQFRRYRERYMESNVTHAGMEFEGDEITRSRLTQALVVYQTMGELTPAWISADKTPYPINAVEDLQALATTVHAAFKARFFEMENLRQQILAASDEAALDAVVIPADQTRFL